MIKTIVLSTLKIAGAFPVFVGIMYGLLQAGKETDFEHAHPALYRNLVDFINFLLAFLVEHWLLWLSFSALLGFAWALIVAEPRATSKREFDRQRKQKLP
jgi:hypothetical protein